MSQHHACTDPSHHVHDGDAFVHEVERACEARGLRLTPIRAHALRLIADAGRPVKAYELLDQMKATHDAAAPPTVYRALDFLLEQFVGLHRPACVGDQAQRVRADRREPQAALLARALHLVHEGVAVVDVVFRVGAGVVVAHDGSGSCPRFRRRQAVLQGRRRCGPPLRPARPGTPCTRCPG